MQNIISRLFNMLAVLNQNMPISDNIPKVWSSAVTMHMLALGGST